MTNDNASSLGRLHVGTRGWLREFRAFLKRGSIVDLAVGVMIGGAFGKIVSSFVADVLTPPIGLLIGEIHSSALKFKLGGPATAPVTVNYGSFVQSLLDFVIVAAVLFAVLRLMKRLRGSGDAGPLTKDQELLVEIRDELRTRRDSDAKNPLARLFS